MTVSTVGSTFFSVYAFYAIYAVVELSTTNIPIKVLHIIIGIFVFNSNIQWQIIYGMVLLEHSSNTLQTFYII
jgi:hypothetical protein